MWDEGTTRGKMINGFLRGIRCLCFMINKFSMCHRKGHFQVLVFFSSLSLPTTLYRHDMYMQIHLRDYNC